MCQLVLEGHPGFTKGIASSWQGSCLAHNSWTIISPPLGPWATTTTVPSQGSISLQVHYDILSGELLVDGRRLGRLPTGYVQHPTYRQIFGSTIVNVVAADEVGMSYRRVRMALGHMVYLGFEKSDRSPTSRGDLLIRIRSESHHLEAVPAAIFETDLPADFITKYTHWLDPDAGVVEFRPLGELWKLFST